MAERSSLVRLQENFVVEVDWRGFELHPEVQPGGMPLEQLFGPGQADGFLRHMDQFAAGFGVKIRQPELIPNTRRALAVTELARDEGKLEAFRDATMEAHWLRGLNIESDQHLQQLARQVGLDPERALSAADAPEYLERIDRVRDEAHQRGVNGIPTFFFGDRVVVGCQGYEQLAGVARQAGFEPR